MIQLKSMAIAVSFATCLAGSALAASAGTSAAAGDGSVYVRGWELPDLEAKTPPLSYGDDPVFGRQMCPALTRLSLTQRRSEDLLVHRVSVEHPGGATVWKYELRPGLFWWNGQAVSAEDLAGFLRDQLPTVAAARGFGLWPVPDVKVTVSGEAVSLHFAQEPSFGPYVFNGVPFYRATSKGAAGGTSYECVGLYRPEAEAKGVALRAAPGYKSRRPLPALHVLSGAAPIAKQTAAHTLSFVYADASPNRPASRPSDTGMSCSHSLELPTAMMIVWNTREGLTANRDFRRALGHLIPRGALVNAGAAGMAEVSSSPVPRQHPGYNPLVAPKPFDLLTASALLNQLGYRRETAVSPRTLPTGAPVQLVLVSHDVSSGLLEKVLTDAFSAVGIGVTFQKTAAAGDHVDGVLGGFALDWPRLSLLGNFHSGVQVTPPFAPLGDKALDHQLEHYAASLTTATPDFTLLAGIQKQIADLEPVTVLFHTKACVELGNGLKLAKGNLSPKDPDWFRQLLL